MPFAGPSCGPFDVTLGSYIYIHFAKNVYIKNLCWDPLGLLNCIKKERMGSVKTAGDISGMREEIVDVLE